MFGFTMNKLKRIVYNYVDCFNRGDLDGLQALFAPDARVYGVLGRGTVPEIAPIWRALMDCLDIQLEIDDIISEGNMVAVRYREHGDRVSALCVMDTLL